jgi:hypothetical protein
MAGGKWRIMGCYFIAIRQDEPVSSKDLREWWRLHLSGGASHQYVSVFISRIFYGV